MKINSIHLILFNNYKIFMNKFQNKINIIIFIFWEIIALWIYNKIFNGQLIRLIIKNFELYLMVNF